MTRMLQINLNCCKVAQQLMLQTATEKKADVFIVCEQNTTLPHWHSDTDGKAAIEIHQETILEEVGDAGKGTCGLGSEGSESIPATSHLTQLLMNTEST